MFLRVMLSAYPGCPGEKSVKWLLLRICVCVESNCEHVDACCLLKATQWRKSVKAEIWWYICIDTLRESSWQYQKVSTRAGISCKHC